MVLVDSPEPSIDVEPGPWLQIGPPRRLRRVTATLPIAAARLPEAGLRIVHLSDLHLRRTVPRGLVRLAEELRRDPPDLLLFTGDFVDDKLTPTRHIATLAAVLDGFRGVARLGSFGIIGNHDGDTIAARLEAMGVVPLHGRYLRVESGQTVVDLLGMPGTFRHEWPEAGSLTRDADVPLVVLNHYPDEVRRLSLLRPDLYLAGHTHGGQIALPTRPLMTHDTLPNAMSSGIHRVGETWLCVSRGVGTTRLPFRVFSPPEWIDLRLVRANEPE